MNEDEKRVTTIDNWLFLTLPPLAFTVAQNNHFCIFSIFLSTSLMLLLLLLKMCLFLLEMLGTYLKKGEGSKNNRNLTFRGSGREEKGYTLCGSSRLALQICHRAQFPLSLHPLKCQPIIVGWMTGGRQAGSNWSTHVNNGKRERKRQAKKKLAPRFIPPKWRLQFSLLLRGKLNEETLLLTRKKESEKCEALGGLIALSHFHSVTHCLTLVSQSGAIRE